MRRGKIYPYSYALEHRRKSWRRWLILWLLLFLPALLLMAELTLRLAGGWLGLEQVTDSQIDHAYTLATDQNGISLQVRHHGSLGYVLLPQRGNFWQINEQGFRSDEVISAQPPRGVTRLFLLGNSAAFGYGTEGNSKALSVLIEQALNQKVIKQRQELARQPAADEFDPNPRPRFRPTVKDTLFQVINAAVPGYASGNQLSLLAHQIISLRPDGMILLGGYEDLRLPSDRAIAEIAPIHKVLSDPSAYARQQMFQTIGQWFSSTYFVRFSRKLLGFSPVLPPPWSSYQVFDGERLSTDPQEIQARVQRLQNNWRKLALFNIPTLLALQPEITAQPQQLAKLTSLSAVYRERMAQNMPYWQKLNLASLPARAKFVNLSDMFKDYAEPAFSDPIHPTPSASQVLAQAIADQVLSLFPPETRKSE